MRWRKHSNRISFSFIALTLVFSACAEKKVTPDYVARVNDSYLTKAEFNNLLDTTSAVKLSKEEIINNWIKQELLYQEAITKGITRNEEFENIIKNSEKKLAGALLIKDNYNSQSVIIEDDEIKNYYAQNLHEFKLNSDSYLLNILKSNNHDFAVKFRSEVLKKSWSRASEQYRDDTSVVSLKENTLLAVEEIYPQKLSRIVKELYPSEISIVISDEAEYHSVVQIVKIFRKGETAPIENVHDLISKRIIAARERENINEYIKGLYNKYSVEIKN